MRKSKKDKYENLKTLIIEDLKSRGSYKDVDEHIVDDYISLKKIIDNLLTLVESEGVTVDGARGVEEVAHPALVRLPSAQSQLLSIQKQLGIGPYGRKLTTGATDNKKTKVENSAALLRPIVRDTKKAK